MTNEEKAREIATDEMGEYWMPQYIAAMRMAHWKDERQMVFLQRLVLKNPNPAMLELLQREIQQLKTQL